MRKFFIYYSDHPRKEICQSDRTSVIYVEYMILDLFGAGTKVNVLKHDCRQGKKGVEYV